MDSTATASSARSAPNIRRPEKRREWHGKSSRRQTHLLEWDVQPLRRGRNAARPCPPMELQGGPVMANDRSGKLQVKIDTHHCQLSPEEVAKFQDGLAALRRMTENFPVADLHVLVSFRTRNYEHSVKTSLILSGATLVASDYDVMALAAAERCVDNLMRKLKDYKDRLGNVPERQKTEKGTRRELQPTADPDPAAIESAVETGDYAA